MKNLELNTEKLELLSEDEKLTFLDSLEKFNKYVLNNIDDEKNPVLIYSKVFAQMFDAKESTLSMMFSAFCIGLEMNKYEEFGNQEIESATH